MSDKQIMKNSVFGGFKKKDVLEYINNLVNEYEKKIEDLKKEKEDFGNKTDEILEKEKKNSKKYKEKADELEQSLKKYNEKVVKKVKEKEELLALQQQRILELEEKIKGLNYKIENLNSSKEHEEKFKKAEKMVKERVNQIIEKSKQKIKEDYNEKVKMWNKEKEELKKNAFKQSEKILNNAAARIFEFNSEVNVEVKKISQIAKEQASKIIDSAKIIADNMLKKSAEIALSQTENKNFDNVNLVEKFNINILNEKTNADVLRSLNVLKDLNIFKENNLQEKS